MPYNGVSIVIKLWRYNQAASKFRRHTCTVFTTMSCLPNTVWTADYCLQTQFLLSHKDRRRVQRHADFLGRLRHKFLSKRQHTRCTQDLVQSPKTPKFWGNLKMSVTVLPPWSSWGSVPKCTHFWCRERRPK